MYTINVLRVYYIKIPTEKYFPCLLAPNKIKELTFLRFSLFIFAHFFTVFYKHEKVCWDSAYFRQDSIRCLLSITVSWPSTDSVSKQEGILSNISSADANLLYSIDNFNTFVGSDQSKRDYVRSVRVITSGIKISVHLHITENCV